MNFYFFKSFDSDILWWPILSWYPCKSYTNQRLGFEQNSLNIPPKQLPIKNYRGTLWVFTVLYIPSKSAKCFKSASPKPLQWGISFPSLSVINSAGTFSEGQTKSKFCPYLQEAEPSLQLSHNSEIIEKNEIDCCSFLVMTIFWWWLFQRNAEFHSRLGERSCSGQMRPILQCNSLPLSTIGTHFSKIFDKPEENEKFSSTSAKNR